MPNRVTICTLIIELICPFTQVAPGQQSDPVQPPPRDDARRGLKETPGGSASDVTTANNLTCRREQMPRRMGSRKSRLRNSNEHQVSRLR